MIYTVDKIVGDALTAMWLGAPHQSIIDEGDDRALSTDMIIRSHILEAVRDVHMAAPTADLCGGHHFGDSVYWDGTTPGACHGHVLLPADYMRLIAFEMSDWLLPCRQAVDGDHAAYRRQRSRWAGLRGHVERPVCAEVTRPEGRALEFYSCMTTDATVTQGIYMPYPSIDAYGGVDIAPRCYPAVIARLADISTKYE